MRRSMKLFSAAVLGAILGLESAVLPYSTVLASQPTTYRAFEVGPGLDNLSAADEMADYQWALKNNGRIRRTQKYLNIDSLDSIYVHRDENGAVDQVALPPIGPGNFATSSTDAVAGIDINIQPAWKQYDALEQKREIIVAVIDTGIDITHPDLKDAIWVNSDEIAGDGIDNDGNGYVDDVNGWNFFDNNNSVYTGSDDNHGTHGAGTIAATRGNGGIAGISDNTYVKIMPIKALGTSEGKGDTQAVLDAIHYAQANGASICNLSFGSTHSDETIAKAIKDSKMLFVVAAGNGDANSVGYDIDKNAVFPASLPYDNVLTVANLMFDGNLDESSNFGVQSVDLAAPGVYILSTCADGKYAYMSGTSMAAPMVTGAAALLYSATPTATLSQVKNAILSSVHPLDTLSGKVLTGGMLDVDAALRALLGTK